MAQEKKFVFTTVEAEAKGVTYPKDLPKLIETARNLAWGSVKVGAVGLASSGRVYLGANVEFEGLDPEFSIHAEQFLIANLALNSEQELTHLAVSDDGTVFREPCDHCIDILQEMSNAPEIKILIKNADEEDGSFKSLVSHMPYEFVSSLLVQRHNRLVPFLKRKLFTLMQHEASKEALKAANKSYAPHSKCPSAVALICEEKVYAGWYIETVDNNTSLGPVQAALVDFMARGEGKEFDKITGAVLAEKQDAEVSQEVMARTLLKKIAPNCVFKVYYLSQLPQDDSREMA